MSAFGWGALAASSLLLGALIVMWRPVRQVSLGLIMAFGAGVLISAVAYELIAESIETAAGSFGIVLGFAAGALTFYVGDWFIDRMGGDERKRSRQEEGGSSLALLLGIVLDGIPESITLGLTLLTGEGVSVAMLAAVFLSNLPESMAATTGFEKSGRSRSWIILLWLFVIAVSGFAAAAGYLLLDGASSRTIAFVNAFAAGAILTMLADTMMPEAFEYGHKAVGLLTSLGFVVAVALVLTEFA